MVTQLTDNFWDYEFACKDEAKTPVPEEYFNNMLSLARNLQVLRDYLNALYERTIYIHIESAYRTPKHNEQEGGVSNSQHLYAKAADIKPYYKIGKKKYWLRSVDVRKAILFLISEGKMDEGGVGIYNTFVHYDNRGTKGRWDYRTNK